MYSFNVLIPLHLADKFTRKILNRWFKSDDASLTRHKDSEFYAWFTFCSDIQDDVDYAKFVSELFFGKEVIFCEVV